MVFETDDPAVTGEQTITYRLFGDDGGTVVDAVHDGLPAGIAPEDNELGWRISLAAMAEAVR
ncbi:SRPBCC domain-containing protein [Nocardia sp. 2YAB30]|uniref:SRPBCC domain-containing protein n=1 Tax=unclassified Nocardia TaxID=2637762 RepID=UPI003F97A231